MSNKSLSDAILILNKISELFPRIDMGKINSMEPPKRPNCDDLCEELKNSNHDIHQDLVKRIFDYTLNSAPDDHTRIKNIQMIRAFIEIISPEEIPE